MTHSSPITVAVLGASGYSGAELMRLLARRADVRISAAVAHNSAGQRFDALYPSATGVVETTLLSALPADPATVDVAFVALPSGGGLESVPGLRDRATHVIDLGGDFRLQDAAVYKQFYGRDHTASGSLADAVYGLPELNRTQIASARLVANPGCYPTSAILGLLPAMEEGIVQTEGISIVSMSGVSGAGRSAKVEMSFAEINENIRAYKVGVHQHLPEIESVLAQVAGAPVRLSFVPHLVPLTRGIHTTIHARLTRGTTTAAVVELYRSYFANSPFVRIRTEPPEIRGVLYTNFCDITPVVEEHSGQLVILSVIDNLVKGAAGQAIQNMNIMLGLPETMGLI